MFCWVLAHEAGVPRALRAGFGPGFFPAIGSPVVGGAESGLDVAGETTVDLDNFRTRLGGRVKIIWASCG